MIRKPTLVLLGILILALLLGWIIEFSPWKLGEKVTVTSTPAPAVLSGLSPTEIVYAEIQPSGEQEVILLKNQEGKYYLQNQADSVQLDQGAVQQLLSELFALEIRNSVDPASSLDVLGLNQAILTITLRNQKGIQHTIIIGNKTPTGNGYYLQLDRQVASVVNSSAVEQILALASLESLAPKPDTSEPAPSLTNPAEITPTP